MKLLVNRNFLLIGLLLLTTLVSCQDEDNDPVVDPNEIAATITLNNVGASAYIIESVDGEGAAATTGAENVSIELQTGRRYRFVNNAGTGHPIEFLSSSNDLLLAQNNQTGSFESDGAVNFMVEGDNVTFTLTSELASEIAKYRCSFHPGMMGPILIVN